ncbi:polysaccharide deacetylase family protein [Oscillatoria amoena NRMC-F 0135]|nr:polysaccharide deacetylase family protein [Oscillatoria laete-virens]MDL5050546.1 polysaccharide deacetylase family protein [Oscillatoria amoena NRMC-F 0135]MDL5055560.1 polysaccharide deacetylase family protein [Oscillatoria laete-virens NRMC-F 0139]
MPKNYTGWNGAESRLRGGTAIFAWHHIARPPWGARIRGLYVDANCFRRQLSELQSVGYEFIRVGDVLAGDTEKKAVVTIDDGYVDVLENGMPVLESLQIPAILYVVAGKIGGINDWDSGGREKPSRLMNHGQIAQWLAAGFEIGAHSMSHPRLTQIAPEKAREEIAASRKRIEDEFQVPVNSFCYPYGDCNGQIARMAAEAGYSNAVTLEPGVNASGQNPFLLRRFSVRRPMNPLKRLSRKLRGKSLD